MNKATWKVFRPPGKHISRKKTFTHTQLVNYNEKKIEKKGKGKGKEAKSAQARVWRTHKHTDRDLFKKGLLAAAKQNGFLGEFDLSC